MKKKAGHGYKMKTNYRGELDVIGDKRTAMYEAKNS